MVNQRIHRLGDLQLRLLKILWQHGPASVADVHARLGPSEFAYTTVATMLRKMEVRRLVRHREEGRRFIYQAAVTAQEVGRSTTADLVDRLFGGNLADAVSHLLESREVSIEELDRLERLIQDRKRRR
jgi:predicted transcriptional regulator